MGEEFWNLVGLAGLVIWLAGTLFFLVQLGTLTARGFERAPARENTLSLPIAGIVIVFYMMMQMLALGVLLAAGFLQLSDLGHLETLTQRQAAALEVAEIASILLTAAVVIAVVPRFFKAGLTGLGLHPRQIGKGLLQGIAAFFIFYPLMVCAGAGLEKIYQLFHYKMKDHPTIQALEQNPTLGQEILLIATAVLVAPLSEELFFRGLLQTMLGQYGFGLIVPQLMRPEALRPGYRPSARHRWLAIVLASACFAYAHQWDQAPLIFVLALGLGYLYERTGNLWASMTFHMLFNLTSISALLAS